MTPVQPGWVAVAADDNPNGTIWFHIVGWVDGFQPVCADSRGGVFVWRTLFGEDKFIIATLEEWTGRKTG